MQWPLSSHLETSRILRHIYKVKCHPAYSCAPLELSAEEMLRGPDTLFFITYKHQIQLRS